MSALMNLKNVTMSLMRSDTPKHLRAASVNLFNAIEEDLNICNYSQSSEVDKAVLEFDKALIEMDTEVENENSVNQDDQELQVKIIKDRTPPEGYSDTNSRE